MPTQKDILARQYLELARQREEGAFTYVRKGPAAGPEVAAASERSNWNVTAADIPRIEAALADDSPFTDKAIETEESSLKQINDAVQRMRRNDVSKYNHVPQFLREYYGRKALIEVFGSADEFPPLTEELKRKLDRMTLRPEFRDAIARLIEREAVDRNGESAVPQLRAYDTYLNERMLADTLAPVSPEEAGRIRQKYPGQQGEKMLADNADRQRFIAKSLFLAQLGRMDIIDEDESRHPYRGSVAELFSHGSRVAFSLPYGEKAKQDLVYDAWRKNALDTGVMFKGRFASHELHRRRVDVNGYQDGQFKEIRIRWKDQLKRGQVYKKVTTYFGNYGMNIPLGGMGKPFNGGDCVDDRGSFGHLYMRTRKGDPEHCGVILMGFENAQPKKESCIGQLHNFKAISHDLSSFYSTKNTLGKTIGGREADLTHLSAEDLTGALNQFELGYRTLQERAKTDPKAAGQLNRLNQALCGSRLPARELANLMTSLGMGRDNALRCVRSARSPQDADYSKKGAFYNAEMYEVDRSLVREPDPGMPSAVRSGPAKQAGAPIPQKSADRYQSYIEKRLKPGAPRTRKELADDFSRILAANLLKEKNKKYDLTTIEHIAKLLRGHLALDALKAVDLAGAMQSEETVKNKSLELRDKLYRVPANSEMTYCMSMKRLLKNMVDPTGHSEAYQKLYQNVKNASQLKQALPWKDPDKRASALMEANLRIMESVKAYISGKESSRSTLRGVNTFDSALDAAACVQRFVPGVKLLTDTLIEGINSKRKPQERLAADALSKEYGRGVNRNEIKSWDELKAVKGSPAAPGRNADAALRGI